jgi:folate-binding protein YgfZ
MNPLPRDTPASPAPFSAGVVRLTGRDATALLQNISSQRLDDLAPGHVRLAVFCDFRGRLLHRATVARTSDQALWLVRGDEAGTSLAAHLERHVFREDVHIEDQSGAWRVIPHFDAKPTEQVAENGSQLARVAAPRGPVYELMPIEDAAGRFDDPAIALGWESRRIRTGWARQGHEIAEAFSPFEVGLGHAVHLDKGCYTGQEVLMRLVTYRSVRRRLVTIGGRGMPTVPGEVRDTEGRPVGRLTSAVSETDGWIALAVLNHEACEADRAVTVEGAGEARVVEVFPFAQPVGRLLQFKVA